MNFSSYALSILLHAVVLLAAFFWPASPPLDLSKPSIQISINMGAPGGDRMPSPVLGPQGQQSPSQASHKPAPPAAQQQSAQAATALPDQMRPERLEAKAEARPESQKVPKPVPVKENEPPKPTPVPKEPDAVALSRTEKEKPKEQPKQEPKPEPKPEPKQEPKTEPKPEPKQEPKQEPKPEPEKKRPSSDDILKAALADAQKKSGSKSGSSQGTTSGRSSIAGALAQAERSVKQRGAGGGGGGEGEGPGGGGLYDVYAGQVILAVRPNWSAAIYNRDQLIVMVRVRLDPQGNVLDAGVDRSSGRADFDASAVNAVLRTKTLPPPPTPEQQEIVIAFNSLEMAGR